MNLLDYRAPPDLLKERVILVTGASSGLGRAAALAFAAHGATVILHGRDQQRLASVYDEIEARGGPSPALFPLDLAQAGDREFEAMAQGIEAQFGRLDGILHSAVQFIDLRPLSDQTLAQWLELFRVNLVAPFALTRACAPLLRRAADASVIVVSETHAAHPSAYWGGFAVAKSALPAWCRIQADEWSDCPGLRINVVIPGPMATPQRRRSHPGEADTARADPVALMPAYLYLIGPASRGMTGQVIELQPPQV